MNLMARLTDRDLTMLSVDRNVPEPLRIAARKKVVSAISRR
jgi:ABC-type lipopolysaccharide export system ATPase subunit